MATYSRSSTQQWSIASSDNTLIDEKSSFTGPAPGLIPNQGGNPTSRAASPRQLGAPFKAALVKFRARLSGTQLTEFQSTTYEQLCQEIIRIQHDQENQKTLMNLSRIQSCLEAMNQFGKVIEVFLNVSDVVAFVWGPIKFLLLTASNFAESFEALLDAYEQIGQQLPLLSEYELLFRDSPHMLDALELMYIDILEFHLQAMRSFTGKVWRRLFKSIWKDFKTRFDGILKSLSRHKDLIECRANLVQYRRYQDDMTELKSKIDAMVENEKVKKIKSVKEWLATGSQAQQDHEEFLAIRKEYPSTGRWILKHESITNWMDADVPTTPITWMTGIPGAGKTILASVIIEECKRRNEYLTGYFYCNNDNPVSNSAVAIVKGLLDQLMDQYPHVMPYCHSRYSTSGEPSLRSLTLAKKVLEDFCLTIPKLYIIVDGLDECEPGERKQILDFFVWLVGQCDTDEPGKLRVLFVSQDCSDIKRALHSSTVSRIAPKILPLSSTDNERDIRVYVNDWTAKIKQNFELNEEQADILRDMTVNRAHGMFLYAKLVMPNLFQQPTRHHLIQEISVERFPRGLEEAYERILSRIKNSNIPERWQEAKKLLGWMVCAKRQLTWKEMQVALSINFEAQTIDYDDRRLRTHIYDICGSLVQLTGHRVHLVHSTAKLYITKCTQEIHEPSVECDLAALCLQYLTFPCFDNENDLSAQDLRQYTLEGHLAFQDYAVAKWFHHVNAFINSGQLLLSSGLDVSARLEEISIALDDFLTRYDDENWDVGIVPDCREKCKIFANQPFYDNLVAVASHIYTFQKKGFDARHVVSIKSLAAALERNRNLLEELPKKLEKGNNTEDMKKYREFYDEERKFKCTKITCIYFSEGFKDAKSRRRHINLHDRPYQCEASDCLATEYGFSNSKDLEKHMKAFHPEMTDLAQSFKPSNIATAKRQFDCSICGKSFTRNFHKKDHEKSHRGERPHECPECGKAFTRLNDMKRHQKLHERR